MKLSLAWIFDHLEDSWQNHSITDLVNRFNTHCAEIESAIHYTLDLTPLALAEVITLSAAGCTLYCPEWKIELELPKRPDAHLGKRFMITRATNAYAWASPKDLGHAKEGFLGPVCVNQKDFEGDWKNSFETEDYIIEIENKSITHRSDLWCHRGIAREFSLLCDTSLVPYNALCSTATVHEYDHFSGATTSFAWILKREAPPCHRFAATLISHLPSNDSTLSMSSRLLRVDTRPTNLIVDTTNYVMFDVGQPLHAFDATKLTGKVLVQRAAKDGEMLTLLDGKKITLTNSDTVVADQSSPVALAGIMGGLESSTSNDTQEFLIEAATYEGSSIRKTATRLKLRTESSARFEKSLDPDNVLIGLKRFIHLIKNASTNRGQNVPLWTSQDEIHVVGAPAQKRTLSVAHAFIEQRLGISLDPVWVTHTLEKLDFKVTTRSIDNAHHYILVVPTLRSVKDITIQEDIVEEIGRCWGYHTIPLTSAPLVLKAHSLKTTFSIRTLKTYLATAGAFHQICTYALFDETFLNQIGFDPGHTLSLMNPISQNYTRLITNLVVNLLKGIADNRDQTEIRLFEVNKVWPSDDPHTENTHLAGLIYSRHKTVDFYQSKTLLLGLFKLLNLSVEFVKQTPSSDTPWFAPYQTAALVCQKTHVGVAGMANPLFLQKIEAGQAFIFEINLDLLLKIQPEKRAYIPLAKYPGTHVDLSLLVPASLQAATMEDKLSQAHPAIVRVELIDMFQKKEWLDQRSLTFRIYAQEQDRTLIKEDIDAIYHAASQCALTLGGTIR